MEEKKCRTCGVVKNVGAFYKQRKYAGKQYYCGSCKKCYIGSRKEYLKEYQKKNAEKIKAQIKIYQNTPEAKENRRISKAQYNLLHKNRYKARYTITGMLQRGKLKRKPCEKCSTTESIHAHHDDYNKPLEIRWLCAKCHREWHRNNTALS